MSGVKGDNSVKIFGPDLDSSKCWPPGSRTSCKTFQGIENVGIFHIRGQSHLEFRVDPDKCEKWGVMTADVNNVVSSALGAAPQSSMVEGEKLFDIAIRWPKRLRNNETSILDIPVDIINNQVVLPPGSGPCSQCERHGFGMAPDTAGTLARTDNPITQHAPRLRLRDLVIAGRRRTARRTPTASSSAPAPRTSTASTASA